MNNAVGPAVVTPVVPYPTIRILLVVPLAASPPSIIVSRNVEVGGITDRVVPRLDNS